MLQRIQTLYLLLIAGLMSVMLFTPLARCTVDGTEDALMIYDFVWLAVLFALSALLPFVVVWLFKNRLLQLRLCIAELALLVGSQGFALWYAVKYVKAVPQVGEVVMSQISTTVVFPLVCFILCILAVRAIYKDEKLVRSLNRIR